jgi:putative endopeptidase
VSHPSLKRLALSLAVAAVFAPALATASAAPVVLDESKLPQAFHFDAKDLDPATPVCKDLNMHVNGKWMAANPIPADKTSYGTGNIISDRSLGVQQQIVEGLAKKQNAPGSNAQKIGDVYRIGNDVERANKEGIAPLKPTLAKIDAIEGSTGIADFLYDAYAHGDQYVFAFGPESDFQNPGTVAGFVFEGGLSLPERAYYLEDKYKDIRDAFTAHVERMLVLGGVAPAAAKKQAAAVLAFETRLATASLTPIEMRDPKNQYHWVSVAEANKVTPHFSWDKFLAAENVDVDGFSLSQPKFMAEFDKMLAEVPVADWQAYLRYHALSGAAPFLSSDVDDENFAFYGTKLTGQPQQRPRWKRVLGTINGSMGEALGQLYVAQVFPEESKQKMQQLVGNLLVALKARLENLDWMSPETKAKALEKLATFDPKIGYPDKWRDYSKLVIDPNDSYFDVAVAMQEHENAWNMAKIGKPVDRTEWGMNAQTVNAYYNPLKNEIVFPAAILQPPFFDPDADPALNYGGIGAVIGHEIMHGFDDQGSQFDAKGRNANWWTEADRKAFEERTAKLVKQFDDYVAVDDVHVKGQLTLGENIGDLSGVRIAYDALQKDLENKRIGLIDGLTQDQRFFLNYATIWRNNMRPEALKVMVNSNPHAPGKFRAIAAPSNMSEFAEAFDCKPTDPAVRSGANQVIIW